MSNVLEEYGKKFKTEDMKELYEFWQKSLMSGPISFYGTEDEKWSVSIEFYESYKKLDNEEENLKALYITKTDDKYKIEISESYIENVVEVKYGDFETVKEIILSCYEEIKSDIKD